MGNLATRPVTVRMLPEEYAQLQKVLGLPANTSYTDTMRAAVSRLTGIPLDQLKKPMGRPRKDRVDAADAPA
ncbi:hypothetical protein ACWGCC_30380 [Streptomyces nigrescens]